MHFKSKPKPKPYSQTDFLHHQKLATVAKYCFKMLKTFEELLKQRSKTLTLKTSKKAFRVKGKPRTLAQKYCGNCPCRRKFHITRLMLLSSICFSTKAARSCVSHSTEGLSGRSLKNEKCN